MSAFANGNGSGTGTHLSLYVRVVNGEYDPLLEWPFTHDVTFTVLDQGSSSDPTTTTSSKPRQHVSVRLSPDPTWKNFQQPQVTNPQNKRMSALVDDSLLGFGYPKFISHKQLNDHNSGYLKGNCLFIKAVVDTSTIVIP